MNNEQIESNSMQLENNESQSETITSNVEVSIDIDSTMTDTNNEDKEEGEVDEEEGMIVEETQPTEIVDKSLCQICKINKWKYTCPKCSIHTCSLPCVKTHKKEFDCDGKRDKVKYVAMNDYNENNLRNGNKYII